MAWRVLLIIGAFLAVACAGLALYSSDQLAESMCVERRDLVLGDPGYRLLPGDPGYVRPPGVSPEDEETLGVGDRILNEDQICTRSEDAPLPILRSGSERWWWFSAVAVAILTAAAMPLVARRGGHRPAA